MFSINAKWTSLNCLIWILFMIVVNINTSSSETITNTDNREGGTTETKTSRSLLTDMARELIGRQSGTSQVLSLNLTNLIILLILKGLIFGTALIGSGSWKGRSLEENIYENVIQQKESLMVNEPEFLLFLSYLVGETTQNYECLKRVACSDRSNRSTQYLLASKMFMKSVSLLKDILPLNRKYEELVGEVQAAIGFGKSGGNCEERYICNSQNET